MACVRGAAVSSLLLWLLLAGGGLVLLGLQKDVVLDTAGGPRRLSWGNMARLLRDDVAALVNSVPGSAGPVDLLHSLHWPPPAAAIAWLLRCIALTIAAGPCGQKALERLVIL